MSTEPMRHVSANIPGDLLEEIDSFAEMTEKNDGRSCTRTQAIIVLLRRALADTNRKRKSA